MSELRVCVFEWVLSLTDFTGRTLVADVTVIARDEAEAKSEIEEWLSNHRPEIEKIKLKEVYTERVLQSGDRHFANYLEKGAHLHASFR